MSFVPISSWLAREPVVSRSVAAAEPLLGMSRPELFERCVPPVFADVNVTDLGGEITRRRVEDISHVTHLYRRHRGRDLIVYLFRLGQVDPRFADLEARTLPEFRFRFLALLGSLADRDSTIATHADMIDTLIVQLTGSRRWQVYPAVDDVQSASYLHQLVHTRETPQPSTPPALDLILEPGDVLYIPAMCPHGATTCGLDNESFSLSIGFTALSVLRALWITDPSITAGAALELFGPKVFELLSDPPPGIAPGEHLAAELARRINNHPGDYVRALSAFDPVAIAQLNFPQ